MSQIEILIANELRTALKSLEHNGIGFIDLETTGNFYYMFEGKRIRITIDDVTGKE